MKKIMIFIISLGVLIMSSCSVKQNKTDNSNDTEITEENEKIIENNSDDVVEKIERNTIDVENLSSIDNKGFGWGFVKKKGEKPDIPTDTIDIFNKYNTYYINPKEPKTLYLTFDEGYEAGYTGQILDILKKNNVKAAFFVTGDYFDRENELVKRMIDDGHIVGNHTEKHKNLHKLESPERIKDELNSLDEKFYNQFGTHMQYMRPPEGEYSQRVLATAYSEGYKTILWSFAYKDWLRNEVRGKEYAINQVVPYFHNGEIILLHAVSKDNSDALEDIINTAIEEGYSFGSLDDFT